MLENSMNFRHVKTESFHGCKIENFANTPKIPQKNLRFFWGTKNSVFRKLLKSSKKFLIFLGVRKIFEGLIKKRLH